MALDYRSLTPLVFSYDLYNNLKCKGGYPPEANIFLGSISLLTDYLTFELAINSMTEFYNGNITNGIISSAFYLTTRPLISTISSIRPKEKKVNKNPSKIHKKKRLIDYTI